MHLGRRPKAAKERTRGRWCAEGAARSSMGIRVTRKVCATTAMGSRASNGAPGGKRKQVLMVEVAVERGHRRFT